MSSPLFVSSFPLTQMYGDSRTGISFAAAGEFEGFEARGSSRSPLDCLGC